MAISTSPKIEGRQRGESSDPILDKLSRTNTFDCDWPTLREHLQQSLKTALPLFLSRGPPRPYRPPISPIIGPIPIRPDSSPSNPFEDEGEKPPSESLLLSPSPSTTGISTSTSTTTPESSTLAPNVPRSVDVEPSATPSSGRLDSLTAQDDLRPSTQGGLVIPPFPPLDRNKRNRADSTPGPSYSGGQIISSPRGMNGMRGQRIVTIGPQVMDDEYDEQTTIGGKILPGWMDNEEGQNELDRVVGILDDMDIPPFTLQRLSELLLQPTKYHTTFGKFLRAVEKALLVTSPWEPPSYNPATSQSFTMPTARSVGGSSSSASSDNGYDSDSTMPPGSTTPMFSPIPFLAQHDEASFDNAGGLINGNGSGSGSGGQQRSLDDGLMSPLMLSEENGMFGSTSNPRSPTPEPEDSESGDRSENKPEINIKGNDDIEMNTVSDEDQVEEQASSSSSEEQSPRPAVAQGQYESIEHSDPAHQSYLGRVDELDTGPITNSPTTPTNPSTEGHLSPSRPKNGHRHEMEEIPVPGTGEGGNMTPHGMSEKPVPISSTTVVTDGPSASLRTIASLPRSASEKSLRDRFISAGAELELESESGAQGEGEQCKEGDKEEVKPE